MKKVLLKLMLALCLTAFVNILQAQVYSRSDVEKVYRSNMNALTSNGEVIGYYAFYLLDKVDSRNNLYGIEILDNNLKQTHWIELKKSKDLALISSGFNGDRFCFAFLNLKTKSIDYELIDKEGNKAGKFSVRGLSNNEMLLLRNAIVMGDNSLENSLIPIPGKGFVRYGADHSKGWKLEMDFFDNKGKRVWDVAGATESPKAFERGTPVFANEKVIASLITVNKSSMSRKVKTYLLFHDIETGKELYRLEPIDEYTLWPNGVTYNEKENEYYVYGEYYNPDDKVLKDKSQGFFFQTLGKGWKETNMEYVSWTEDIGPTISKNRKGKYDPKMYLAIHTVLRSADGKFFAVAEQYKKSVSAGGAAINALALASGGGQTGVASFKIELHDMIVFEFDKSFSLNDIHTIDKPKTNVMLPQGWGILPPPNLALIMKRLGEFDYVYTSSTGDQSMFTSSYVNYGKEKGEKRKLIIGNVIYNQDQQLVEDNLSFDREPTIVKVFPARHGYIAVFEYYAKDKRVEMRLEKLNS